MRNIFAVNLATTENTDYFVQDKHDNQHIYVEEIVCATNQHFALSVKRNGTQSMICACIVGTVVCQKAPVRLKRC